MDRFYGKEGAKLTIDMLTQERASKDPLHLTRLYEDQRALENVGIMHDDDTQVWRLSRQRDEGGGIDELVFTITGAIAHVDLPPIQRETNGMRDKLRFLTQSVTITGLGSEMFRHAIESVKEVRRNAERDFRQGQVEDWKPEQFQGEDAVEVSNRYFRPRGRSEQETGVPLNEDVDPNGVLARLAGTNMIHTEDNVVKYFRVILDSKKKRYVAAKPQAFRIGDIAEVQCLIVFVKSKGRNVKTKLILRALALVSCEHAMNAEREQVKNMGANGPTAQKVKRKVGFEYSNDEVEVQTSRKKRNEDDEGGMED